MSSSPFSPSSCPTYGKDDSELLSAGYVDSTGNLAPEYDAATAHLGAPWRMPTDAEFAALTNNCIATWITTNGVSGRLVTGTGAYADRSIFGRLRRIRAIPTMRGTSTSIRASSNGTSTTAANTGCPSAPCGTPTSARIRCSWWLVASRLVGRGVPPSLLMIENNYLKQLALCARANSPAPICRSSNCHDSECSRCVRRIMLFLKVVLVVSKSHYAWVKYGDVSVA